MSIPKGKNKININLVCRVIEDVLKNRGIFLKKKDILLIINILLSVIAVIAFRNSKKYISLGCLVIHKPFNPEDCFYAVYPNKQKISTIKDVVKYISGETDEMLELKNLITSYFNNLVEKKD